MVKGRFYSGQDDLTEIIRIRQQVFTEELGIDAHLEADGQDDFCMHVLAFADDAPVAVGRISYDGWEFVISKVAVLPEHRGKKYGDFIVRMLVDKAMMSNATQVKMDAFEDVVPFFETIGFSVVGDGGDLAGRKLVQMVLHTDQIHKCCNCKH